MAQHRFSKAKLERPSSVQFLDYCNASTFVVFVFYAKDFIKSFLKRDIKCNFTSSFVRKNNRAVCITRENGVIMAEKYVL